MSKTISHWWRAYDRSVDNAKLQRLPGDLFKAWYNLCCLASANGGMLPSFADIAFKLRLSETKARNVVETLQEARLIDGEGSTFKMHEWDEYQYKSDVSTERVKQHRERQRNVSSSVSETPSETGDDGSVKRSSSVSVSSTASPLNNLKEGEEEPTVTRRRKPKVTLPVDFAPNFKVADRLGWDTAKKQSELLRFTNSAIAHERVYANWQAAWDNWCESPFQQSKQVNGHAAIRSGNSWQNRNDARHEALNELSARVAENEREFEAGDGGGEPAF